MLDSSVNIRLKPFLLIVSAALIAMVLIGQHRQIVKLKKTGATLKSHTVTQNQMLVDLRKEAFQNSIFSDRISAFDMLLWSSLVGKAEASPESTVLKEYNYGSDGTTRIPIVVRYNDHNSQISYVAVVGMRWFNQHGASGYEPCFVVYSAIRDGAQARVDFTGDQNKVDVLINHKWLPERRLPWNWFEGDARIACLKASQL